MVSFKKIFNARSQKSGVRSQLLILIAVFCLLYSNSFAQGVVYYGGGIGNVYAGDYDGSTEYLSNSSPVNLDLNDTNRIALQADIDFEDSLGNWTGTGNHSVDTSSVSPAPLTGSYSGVIINTLGSELVTDGDMSNAGSWTFSGTPAWSIAGGVASYDDSVPEDYMKQNITITNGKNYKITFIISNCATTANFAFLQENGNALFNTVWLSLANGSYEYYWLAIASSSGLRLNTIASSDTFDIDDVSIKEYGGNATSNYVSLPAADFTALEDGISYTFEWQANSTDSGDVTLFYGSDSLETWTISDDDTSYYIVNFICDTSVSGAGAEFILFVDQPDTIYCDMFNVSEAYNMTIMAWAVAVDQGDWATIVGTAKRNNEDDEGFWLGKTTNGISRFDVYHNDVAVASVESDNKEDTLWHHYALTINHTDADTTTKVYIDGDYKGTAYVNLGIVRLNYGLTIGRVAQASGWYWENNIGEIQIIRGQVLTAAEILAAYNRGIKGKHFLETGNEVGWWKWAGNNDTDFLKDETGNNNLTGTNMTQVDDQIKLKKYAD